MFINVSNHSCENWSEEQRQAAGLYGEIIDYSFPQINPNCADEDINRAVEECLAFISGFKKPVVMVQGEFVFTFRLVTRLKAVGVKAVAAVSGRNTLEYPTQKGTKKLSEFVFAGFIEY